MKWVVLFLLLSCAAFAQQATQQPTVCNNSAQIQMTTATTTQIVGLVAGTKIRICAYAIQGSTIATATTLKFVSGTGAACVTGTANLTPAWSLPASNTTFNQQGNGVGEIFNAGSGNALCATSSAAGTVNIFITFAQF